MSVPGLTYGQGTLAADQSAQRALVMRRAYESYVGRSRKPLIARQGEPDDNLIISLGRLIVDKGVSFLFGQYVTSQVGDTLGASTVTKRSLTRAKTAPRQDWLDECWRRNRRSLTLQKLATNGGICGHAFARILDTKPWPRVIVLDPQTIQVETDPDDIDTVWCYTITPPPQITQEDEPAAQRRTIIRAEVSEGRITALAVEPGWTITDQIFSGGAWVNTATRRWPYPFSPIAHCQNLPKPNDFWGESDLPEDLIAVLDSLNRIASHYSKIIRLHAHPKIWTRGMGARTLDVGIDSVINLPSETAELKALEMHSNLASTLSLLQELLQYISMMARIPLVAMGMPDNMGAPSGIALQIRYQPLLEKTHTKRETYGDLVQELDRRLLALAGFGDTTLTEQQWHEMLPVDPLLEIQVMVLEESLGVLSKQTISDKLNLDYDAEQESIMQEAQDSVKRGQAALAGAAGAPAAPAPVPGANGVPYPPVPPPAALQAPVPDVAKKGVQGTSR